MISSEKDFRDILTTLDRLSRGSFNLKFFLEDNIDDLEVLHEDSKDKLKEYKEYLEFVLKDVNFLLEKI